jgi:hypothetical protein
MQLSCMAAGRSGTRYLISLSLAFRDIFSYCRKMLEEGACMRYLMLCFTGSVYIDTHYCEVLPLVVGERS